MSTKISKTTAEAWISNYQQGLPPGAMKSGWVSRDFIDAIISLNATHNLDGIRIYLARYTETDSQKGFAAGDDTMVVVPTVNEADLDEYHDYLRICPPHCT